MKYSASTEKFHLPLQLVVMVMIIIGTTKVSGAQGAAARLVQCSNGEYVESEHLCGTLNTVKQSASCTGGYCANNASVARRNVQCPTCLQNNLTVRQAFRTAHFVVRGRVQSTRLLSVYYVEVTVMVQLVMKSIKRYLTPGRLLIAIPLNPDWMCDCPGVENITIGDNYLITGVVQPDKIIQPPGYVLKVYHESLITPWKETILDDMVNNKTEYPKLKFLPHLKLYRTYIA